MRSIGIFLGILALTCAALTATASCADPIVVGEFVVGGNGGGNDGAAGGDHGGAGGNDGGAGGDDGAAGGNHGGAGGQR